VFPHRRSKSPTSGRRQTRTIANTITTTSTASSTRKSTALSTAARRRRESGLSSRRRERIKRCTNCQKEEYDGAYDCVTCCQSVRGDLAVLHCLQCSSNPSHQSCVEKTEFVEKCPQCSFTLSCHRPAVKVDSTLRSLWTVRCPFFVERRLATSLNSVHEMPEQDARILNAMHSRQSQSHNATLYTPNTVTS